MGVGNVISGRAGERRDTEDLVELSMLSACHWVGASQTHREAVSSTGENIDSKLHLPFISCVALGKSLTFSEP